MLLSGDEIGHTQRGNNNAYCKDNEITWLGWDLTPEQRALLKSVRQMIGICREQPVFHRRRFFHGKAIQGAEAPEIDWLEPSGKEMSAEAWNAAFVRCLGVTLSGGSIDVDEHGETIRGDSILMLFNADHANKIPFTLPQPKESGPWELLLDTARTNSDAPPDIGATYELEPVSVAMFCSKVPEEKGEGEIPSQGRAQD